MGYRQHYNDKTLRWGFVVVMLAVPRVGNNKNNDNKPKTRVAAYCRVSTDSDEQATSYEIQIEHYTNFIQKNPEWELAGIFADDGITGTNTKQREEFNNYIILSEKPEYFRLFEWTFDFYRECFNTNKEQTIEIFAESLNDISNTDTKGITTVLTQPDISTFPERDKIICR